MGPAIEPEHLEQGDHGRPAPGRDADPEAGGGVAERLTALDRLLKRTSPAGRANPGPSFSAGPATPGWLGSGVAGAPLGLLAGVLLVVVIAGWFGWRLAARPAPIEDRMPMASGSASDAADDRGAPGSGEDPATAGATDGRSASNPGSGQGQGAARLVVHVAGSVANPGVYALAEGARVADALSAAGGATGPADTARLNLAAPLVDGARVYVPAVGEQPPAELSFDAASPAPSAAGGGDAAPLVNINTAEAVELETLPGIGPATAAAIIEHREGNGSFASVDDLLAVRGIGEAKLDAIAELVTVG